LNLFQSNINDITLNSIFNSLKSENNLKIISLAFNNIKNFDLLETLKNFEELVNLDLSNNLISTINFNQSNLNVCKLKTSKLEILDLSFNCITNFNEILDLIYSANIAKTPNSNEIASNSLLKQLSNFSFFGNPFPKKICDYLFQLENLNLFNFNLNTEDTSVSSNRNKKLSSESSFDCELFYNDLKAILNKLEIFNGNSIQEPPEIENESNNFNSIVNNDILKTFEEATIQKANLNINEIKRIDLNINIEGNHNEDESYDNRINTDLNKDQPIKTEGNIGINYITIDNLKKSENVDRIVKYNLIDDLKQFNVIYHTYSFKKNFAENTSEEGIYNERRLNKLNYSEMEKNNFDKIFQEKVDKDKASDVLLLSKLKLNSIPIIAKNLENENQIDLIYLQTKCNINENKNTKIKYDFECLKTIKIIYLNINKLTNLFHLNQFLELEELYLQNNKLRNLPNFKMKNLKKLDISNNNLITLNGILNLKNLIYFNIENNSINNLNITELINLEDLTEFNISGNNIYNLKECIMLKNMKKIINLDLSGNEVCNNNDFRMTLINYLPKLKILNRIPIDKNEYSIAKEFFEGRITNELLESKIGSEITHNVKELDLSNNKLKDFENIFNSNNFPNLKKLNISRNIFASFRIFGFLPSLEELYLNSNLFDKILSKKDKPISNKGILGLPVI